MPKAKSTSNKAVHAGKSVLISFPYWMTEVTPFSKGLAMAVFIALPFLSFYLGARLQRELMGSYPPFEVVVRQGCSAPMEYKRSPDDKSPTTDPSLDDGRMYKQQ